MKRTRVKELLSSSPGTTPVSAKGWIRTKRESKDLVFFEINDGSCLSAIQVVVDRSTAEGAQALAKSDLPRLQTGASVAVEGTLVESPGKNQAVELHATSIQVIGEAPSDSYPLQKKRHSFEFLREIAHLRPRTNTFGAVMRVRNRMAMAIHEYFQQLGFTWVHTPIITASDAEGAGEMFQVTTLPLEKIAKADPSRFKEGIDYSRDFFGKPSYLTVSGQLNAEIFATALDRVYTFGPTFRAENSNTSRHLAEFWMIEPEVAFCDISCNMDLAEGFLKHVLQAVLRDCAEDMAFFDARIQPGILNQLQEVVDSTFTRITYTQAIADLEAGMARGVSFDYKPSWGADLQSEHEKYLTEEVYHGPVIVTDYPKEIKAFYMKLNEDGKTVRGMDILVPRLGEIIGGSEREERLDVLEARMKELSLDPQDYWWYLDLRRFGTVPHSGFGLGFERLIQYVTGMQNIRDVIPFPRTPKNAEF
ncbi:asparagine--tRNA ligase [Spirochaeta lutea]|uniref:Asparagine--tRNA ligase n=1 Tax=Spirochaeta lutea TaxID=1480694 RepID=A0A098QZJ9_9SPIO|nr:asparagine--tRNA ligase [Spirochaeta lutea]KGE72848.1 asparaginyl-tRNA synthetase [Spirochaeta lutea]